MRIMQRITGAEIGRPSGTRHNAPIAANTISDGSASSSTASNRPATTAAASNASSVADASPSSASTHVRNRANADVNTTRSARPRSVAATGPRSDRNAIQSLLGHGLNVIPGSDGSSDLSPAFTCRGYSTGQLPGPTPNNGSRNALKIELL